MAAQIIPGSPESSARAWTRKPIINYMTVQYKLNTQQQVLHMGVSRAGFDMEGLKYKD